MKKIVIIGAGPAGLSCAYEILKTTKEIEVTIIEENKEVGGISKTVNYKEKPNRYWRTSFFYEK